MTLNVKRKNNFTLLEVVIALLLITIMGSAATFSIHDLIATHAGRASIDQFKNLLDELQIEALTLRSDQQLLIWKKKGKWYVESKTGEKILRNRSFELKGIQNVTFSSPTPLIFDITSSGRILPAGILSLKRKDGTVRFDFQTPLQIKVIP
jgi:Tfp pilus assembly protein FimT